MLYTTKGIVFNAVKYSETSVIAKVYTRDFGLLSFMVNGVRGKGGSIRASHLQPLTLLELVIYKKQNAHLHRIRELKCEPVLTAVHYEMPKTSIVLFLQELLNQVVVEEEKNTDLFDFLSGSIQILDLEKESIANFPAFFLVQLSRFLGFFPGGDHFGSATRFNLLEGVFYDAHIDLVHTLTHEESAAIFRLRHADFETVNELKFSSVLRRNILRQLIIYYQLHLHGLRELQSHLILSEVLG